MEVTISDELKGSGLTVGHLVIENIENKKNRNKRLDKEASALRKEVQKNPDKFKNTPDLKSYSEFVNSTKSVIESKDTGAEILINLILERGFLPAISRVVDCMNIVSVRTGLTVSIWNKDKVNGDIVYKLSKGGEKYWPFMGDEVELLEGELAAFDDEKVLCLVRYRDSKYAPVELETNNIIVHIQGVKGIPKESVEKAISELEKLLLENVGGKTIEKKTIIS